MFSGRKSIFSLLCLQKALLHAMPSRTTWMVVTTTTTMMIMMLGTRGWWQDLPINEGEKEGAHKSSSRAHTFPSLEICWSSTVRVREDDNEPTL